MEQKRIYKILQELSFSEYEAKAYLALLAANEPLSGYAAALQSGVPRSRIYDILSNLEKRGDIIASHTAPTQYLPVSPEILLKNRKKRTEKTFAEAQKLLASYETQVQIQDNIWNIKGRTEIFSRIAEVVGRSEKDILLEIWKEDSDEIIPQLRMAAKRGVKITVVAYGDLILDFADVHIHYPLEKNESNGRWFMFSADSKEALAGIVSLPENECRAAWSYHPGLVVPITQMIIHDLYLLEILKEHEEILEQSFGKNLIKLREKFHIDTLFDLQ